MTGYVAVIDYNMGNVGAIMNMLRKIGAEAMLTRDFLDIERASHVILPGVGSFDRGLENLDRYGLRSVLDELALARRVPVLGICLGMQLLSRCSEEGTEEGLGWLDARTIRFTGDDVGVRKIPHMGWNFVRPRVGCQLFDRFSDPPRFYFAHSYQVVCDEEADIAGTTRYGRQFTSVVAKDNVFGVQFHPEKSHRYGIELLRSFVSSPVSAAC